MAKLPSIRVVRHAARLILIIALISVGVVLFRRATRPATIGIGQPPQWRVNQLATVPVFLETGDQTVNAAEIFLTYDPSEFRVVSVNGDGSFFRLWITGEPRVDETRHEISFAGGLPSPGWHGRGQIGTITLIPQRRGVMHLTIEPKTRILINDGRGTPAALRSQSLALTIAP